MKNKGFTLIELMIVVAVIAAIAIPSLLSSRKAANETKAVGALKAINTAQATYRRKSSTYAYLLSALVVDGGLDTGISDNSADYSGYKIVMEHPTSSAADKWKYGIGTEPVVPGDSGDLSFYTNAKSTIWKQDFGTGGGTKYPTLGDDAVAADGWSVAGQ